MVHTSSGQHDAARGSELTSGVRSGVARIGPSENGRAVNARDGERRIGKSGSTNSISSDGARITGSCGVELDDAGKYDVGGATGENTGGGENSGATDTSGEMAGDRHVNA